MGVKSLVCIILGTLDTFQVDELGGVVVKVALVFNKRNFRFNFFFFNFCVTSVS